MAKQVSPVGRIAGKTTGGTTKSSKPRPAVDIQRQTKVQKALYEIAAAASAASDMQEFYAALHRIVGKLMYARNFYVTLYDPVTKMISAPYYVDEAGDVLPSGPVRLQESSKSLRAQVLLTGRTLHLSAEQIEEGTLRGRFDPRGTPAQDWIGVPLKMGRQVIGSLTVQSYKKGVRYEEQDVRLLEFVAQHIAVALTRARAIEETRQRKTELEVINSVQEGLASNLDIQSIYTLVGDKIRKIFAADTTFIAFRDEERNLLLASYYADRKLRRSFTRPYGTGIAEAIIESGEPLLLRSAQEHLKYGAHHVPSPGRKKDLNQSVLGVPIFRNGRAYGAVSVQSYKVDAFDENDLRLLQTLANSMSVALENARLFDETQERNAELAIINSVQEALASKLEMQAIYELIGEKVRDVFNVGVVDIADYDPANNLISMPYSYEKGDRSVITPREPYGFRLQVINSCAPLLINQDFVELAFQYNNPLLTGAWPRSALFMPLLVEGKVKSIISIQDLDRENAFSSSDVQLLQTLANAMSIALENARLFDETQRLLKETERRARELATVNTVSAALVRELDLSTLIELVGEQVRSVFKADIAFVALLDKENSVINFPYLYGQQLKPVRLGQGLTSRIIQNRQPLLINQDMDRQRQQMGVTRIGKRARSFLGVPIFVGGEPIGVVSVQSTRQEGLFTENDQRLLSTIAASVGTAFQNARLFDETQRVFRAEQQAHEQAEILRSVAQALNRSLSLTEVFNLVLTEIQKVIPYDSAGIYRVQDNRRVFITGRGFTNLEDLIGVSFQFNQHDDEIGYLISRSLQPLILEDASEKYPQYFSTGLHAATKIRSYMAVPIVLNEKLIGMITLDSEEPGFYKDHHARLALTFAAQSATAIENARLFDEAQQRNAELAIINSVQEGLASKLDMQAIYELVGNKIRETFNAQVVSIDTFDRASQLLHSRYYFEGGKALPGTTYVIFGFRKHVIENRQPLVIDSDMSRWMEKYNNPVNLGLQPKSAIFVPMLMGEEAVGVISLQNSEQENAFTEADVRLLQTLANSMSVALENARLFDETQQRNAELAIINSVQQGLASKLEMQAIYDLVGGKIRATFRNMDISIRIYDARTGMIHYAYAYEDGQRIAIHPFVLAKTGFGPHAMRTGETVVINENMQEEYEKYGSGLVPGTLMSKSLVVVPLIASNQPIGVITLSDVNREHAFTEADVRLLQTLANSMSVALENAQLWEQEKMYRRALERELEIGREIQAGFLPKELPRVEGWEIAASLMSAREVAGDFYDAFELPDGSIGLVIADVCDKGVGAALFMTLFRSLIRAAANLDYFEHTDQPNATQSASERLQRTLTLTNNYIAETHGDSGMFATIFFGILDPQDGRLAYINGGHEPPLVLRSGTLHGILQTTGPAVGAIRECWFDIHETKLHPGDMLLAFTDGVQDCRNPGDELFGRDRLIALLQGDCKSAHELVKTIETGLHDFIAGATQFDDITLLAVRRG